MWDMPVCDLLVVDVSKHALHLYNITIGKCDLRLSILKQFDMVKQ